MNRCLPKVIVRLAAVLAAVTAAAACEAKEEEYFVAFSLAQAQKLTQSEGHATPEAAGFGDITEPLGVVYDEESRDLIILGKVTPRPYKLGLDDFVVALRSILVHETWPLVSIDANARSEETKRQRVRFEGGIADTPFGATVLEVDELLKRISLGEVRADTWGVPSYFDMLCDYARRGNTRPHVRSQFWFVGDKEASGFVSREGVVVFENLEIVVETRVVGSASEADRDDLGTTFASSASAAYGDLASEFPSLQRAHALFKLVGLATGIWRQQREYSSVRPKLGFWLEGYQVPPYPTPVEHSLIHREETFDVAGGKDPIHVQLNGGVELRPLILDLQDGVIQAVREVVVKCRPKPSALCWHVPLEHWRSPDPVDLDSPPRAQDDRQLPGFALDSSVSRGGRFASAESLLPAATYRPVALGIPDFKFHSQPSPWSSDVGGVMLAGTAEVEGAKGAEVNVAEGTFSLVVDGKNARIDPKLFRKFVTALWCVYYSHQAPGISIDPIAPDADKHLVRYIGRVINTDLARVMRGGDYRMKEWAVGTQRPDIEGFRDIDTWSYYQGNTTLASRRFWFVPERLRFKRAGDLLLFASGRMQVRTEFLADGLRGQAAPSDKAFAEFFTEHYDEIAEKHPIYKELFEYAKLVALAKYLKEQGVPLHWFLLAHKDLVLTEDSPGTVDQLAKGSQYFQGVTIQGGVDLGAESQYVFDPETLAVINEALAARPAAARRQTGSTRRDQPAPPVQPVSFESGRKSYTVLPQHTLTSGKDHRGTRYQTDLALRKSGQPGLELVRYYNPRNREGGQFGAGWHLLIPYRVKPADKATRKFLNAVIRERMVVENLVSGQQEVLTFSDDRYAAAGYVPDKLESSQVVGLFLMSNGSLRLADKIGNQFHFDPGGRMTDMFLSPSPEHHFHVEYADQFTGAFVQPPYVVRPVDDERVEFLNVRIPKRLRVTDRLHNRAEVLVFRDNNEPAGYVAEDGKTSRFQVMALLSNGGLQLVDKHGNETRFTSGWNFEAMLPARDRQMIRSISMGNRKATFGYTIDSQGQVVVATAALSKNESLAEPSWVIHYEYDEEGRLCRVQRPGFSVAEHRQDTESQLALKGL